MYNLINRAILLSDKKFPHSNIIQVKQIMQENQYPNSFINSCIKKRLFKIKNNMQSNSNGRIYS